jgi:hypothetical protein
MFKKTFASDEGHLAILAGRVKSIGTMWARRNRDLPYAPVGLDLENPTTYVLRYEQSMLSNDITLHATFQRRSMFYSSLQIEISNPANIAE